MNIEPKIYLNYEHECQFAWSPSRESYSKDNDKVYAYVLEENAARDNADLRDQLAALQSDHDAIKNELEAVEEECTSLRNVILSQDEKLDALQYQGNLEE